jgi:hypothetical protein
MGIHRKPPDRRVGYTSRVEANGKEGMGGGRGVTGGGGGEFTAKVVGKRDPELLKE